MCDVVRVCGWITTDWSLQILFIHGHIYAVSVHQHYTVSAPQNLTTSTVLRPIITCQCSQKSLN